MADKTTTPAPTFTITVAEFDALVKGIVQAGARYSTGIGKALLAALYFSIVHSDAGPANTLVGALRKSTKQQAIIDLLQENGNLAWMKVGRKVAGFDFFDAQHVWMPEDVVELRKVCANWEDYKAAPVAKDYDVYAAIEAIIKAIESKSKKTDGSKVIGAACKEDLMVILARHNAAALAAVGG